MADEYGAICNIINDYPFNPDSYRISCQIGKGVNSIVYMADCIPLETSVAIKQVDIEKSKRDLDSKITHGTHPNILKPHCSFTVDTSLWVVMPLVSGGSLQSIMASSYPSGLPEPVIATVLKEILSGLSHIHQGGHVYNDINAGNILIDSDGSVMLADDSTRSSSVMFKRAPYWMAPEAIISPKSDIWSVGIIGLELAHGQPPLSYLPPLMTKLFKKHRFADEGDETNVSTMKEDSVSTNFKSMITLCLDPEPLKRPTAEELMEHSFFNNCKDSGFENLLKNVPPLEQRVRGSEDYEDELVLSPINEEEEGNSNVSASELLGSMATLTKMICSYVKERVEEQKQLKVDDEQVDDEGSPSGWSFNVHSFKFDPVFPESDAEE